MKITVEIEEEELEGDYGSYVQGLRLTCTQCGHEVTVFGTESASARRGAIMLRDECPNTGNNFYDVDWYG